MTEMKEFIQQKVQQGKAKLVGWGKSKPRESFQVETPNQTINFDEPLVITTTGLSAKEAKATEMAHERMQAAPRSPESKTKTVLATPGRLAQAVWNTLLYEPRLERAHRWSTKLLERVQNNVFTDQAIKTAEASAKQQYEQTLANASVMKRAGIKVQNFLRSAAGRQTLVQQLTLDNLASQVTDEQKNILQEQAAAAATRLHEGFGKTDGAIREALGEHVLALDEQNPRHQPIVDAARNLMRDYATTTVSDKDFRQRADGIVNQMKALDPDFREHADLYTSSLFTAAKALRTEAIQQGGIDRVQAAIDAAQFRIAFGVMGAATTIEASTTRKIMKRLEKTTGRFGKNPLGALLFNEATVGTAVAYGLTLAIIPRSAATSAARIIAPVGGSIVGGAFAGIREYRKLGRERKVLMRESETGKQGPTGGKRREWFQRFTIEQKSATELIDGLKTNDPQELANRIAEAQARINISAGKDKKGHTTGLVGFSSPEAIETERTQLYAEMRRARGTLESLDQTAFDSLDELVTTRTRELTEEVGGTQKAFRKAARRRAVAYGGAAAGVGVISSEVFADAYNLIKTGRVEGVGVMSQSARGLKQLIRPEGAPKLSAVETLASRARVGTEHWRAFATNETTLPGAEKVAGTTQAIKTMLPDHTHLVADPKGGYDLVFDTNAPTHAHATILHGLKFDESGRLMRPADLQAQLDTLQKQHLSITLENHQLPSVEVGTSDTGTFNITADQMRIIAGRDAGEWGWIEKVTSGDAPRNANAATNAIKNIFRGYNREPSLGNNNVHINQIPGYPRDIPFGKTPDGKFTEVMWSQAPNNLEVKGLPNALFSDASMHHIAADTQAAIDYAQPLRAQGASWDEIMQKMTADPNMGRQYAILFKAGYMGAEQDIPPAADIKFLMSVYGGTTKQITPFESVFKLEEMVGAPARPPIPIPTPITPVLPHSPLEGLVATTTAMGAPRGMYEYPMRYYYYGEGETFLNQAEYKNRRSPNLIPEAELKQHNEVQWYLSTLSEEDKQNLGDLIDQYNMPIADTVRTVVCIPAHKEETNIRNTLEQYLNQKDLQGNVLDPNLYEVVVYDNYPAGVSPDNTREEVIKFKAEHPEMNIVFVQKEYPTKQPMGRIRRDLSNFVFSRLSTRPANAKDVILISNDADAEKISPTYLATAIGRFDSQPFTDAIAGKWDFPQEAYNQFPAIFASQRAWQFLDSIVKNKRLSGSPALTGANSAVRASTLAAIGGYNGRSHLGEDLEIGWMINAARNYNPDRIRYVHKFSIITDPRRAISKHLKDQGFIDRYADFATDEEVRKMTWEDLAQKANDQYSREFLEKDLTEIYHKLYRWIYSSNPDAFNSYFARAMNMLGIKYEIQNNKIIVIDDTVLRQGLTTRATTVQAPRAQLAAVVNPATSSPQTRATPTSRDIASPLSETEPLPRTAQATIPQPAEAAPSKPQTQEEEAPAPVVEEPNEEMESLASKERIETEVPWPEIWKMCEEAIEKDTEARAKLPPPNDHERLANRVKHQNMSIYHDEAKALFASYPTLLLPGQKPEHWINECVRVRAWEAADAEYFAPYAAISLPILNDLLEKLKNFPVWTHIFTTGDTKKLVGHNYIIPITTDKNNSIYLMTAHGTLRIKMKNLQEFGLKGTVQNPVEQTFFVPPNSNSAIDTRGGQSRFVVRPEVLLEPKIGYSTEEYDTKAFEEFFKGTIPREEYEHRRMEVSPDINGTKIVFHSQFNGSHDGHPIRKILSEIPSVMPPTETEPLPRTSRAPIQQTTAPSKPAPEETVASTIPTESEQEEHKALSKKKKLQKTFKNSAKELTRADESQLENVSRQLAINLHNNWRQEYISAHRAPGTAHDYEPRWKPVGDDQRWITSHQSDRFYRKHPQSGVDEVDIAHASFDQLPITWQKENYEAARFAVNYLHSAVMNGEKLDTTFFEKAAAAVHDAWKQRHPDATGDRALDYADKNLPQSEKNKDREHVVLAAKYYTRANQPHIEMSGEDREFLEKLNTAILEFPEPQQTPPKNEP